MVAVGVECALDAVLDTDPDGMDPVRGRIPPSEIDIEADAYASVAEEEEGRWGVEVDSPFAGQFEFPGAQLTAVTTLVLKAAETAGCKV